MDIAVLEVQTTICPICGSGHSSELWNLPQAERQVMTCDDCGFAFVWPRIEQDFRDIPDKFYYDDWQQLDLEASRGLYYDVVGVARRCGAIRPGRDHSVPLSILEVGCGAGQVLLDFRAHGWRVQGVDPWVAVTAVGQKYYRLPLLTDRIETADIEPGSKDVALAVDVLQFTADPTRFVTACFRALRQGGLFYATVPNFDSVARKREGSSWHYVIPRAYLSYFTPETVTRLLQSVGFVRVETQAFGGPDGDGFLRVLARSPVHTTLTWPDIAEDVDDSDVPPLDRVDVDESRLTPEQRHWREGGYLIMPGLIPDELVDRYCAVREKISDPIGWTVETPYLTVPEIRDVCLYQPLMDMLEHLIGEPMAVSLNLTGWRSTQRAWHQDDYLNSPEVKGHYVAVWIALDSISPDSGPFEFVPGSHRWPLIRRSRILSLLKADASDRNWPWYSEQLLTPFFDQEIVRRNAKVERFLGKKGDVLIWHARLAHCGSLAERPEAERKSLIAHYSGVTRRSDMGGTRRHPGGGFYFIPPSTEPEVPPQPNVEPNKRLKLLRKFIGS